MNVGQVHIGEADGAAVGEVADRGDQLGHRPGDIGRRHDRRIVGAGDGDADGARTLPPWPSSTSKLKVSTWAGLSPGIPPRAAATL